MPKEYDPFDPANLRIVDESGIGTERILLTVPVRKPKPQDFFRVHPDQSMTLDAARIVEWETDAGRETYLVSQAAASLLDGASRPVRIFTCITLQGTVFLWPARLPSASSTGGDRWARSALEIADEAQRSWVRMVSDRGSGAYLMHRAKGDLGDPQWREQSLRSLLSLAFKDDKLIDSADHPIIKALAGE